MSILTAGAPSIDTVLCPRGTGTLGWCHTIPELYLTQALGKLLNVKRSVPRWEIIPHLPGSPMLPTLPIILSSTEIASTFAVVKPDVVDGSRRSAFLLIPLLHLGHFERLPVGGRHHGTRL